jgi:uncharacterized protein YggE
MKHFIFTLLLSIATAEQVVQRVEHRHSEITVFGSATEYLDSSLGYLNAGCHTEAKDCKEARRANAVCQKKLFSALEDNGVDLKKDVSTTSFSIYPVYSQNNGMPMPQEPVIVAFRVSNDVQIAVRKLKRFPTIIDAVIEASGDDVQIGGISFGARPEEEAEAKDKARKGAVESGHLHAHVLAKAAGLHLGRLIEMVEQDRDVMPMPKQRFAAPVEDVGGPATQIAQGQVQVSANVKLVYELV